MASVTGFALDTKRTRSWPCTTRPGIGSDAVRRVSVSTGSSRRLAASTRLPNPRPRRTGGSAIRQACGKTDRAVATCARACHSGAPSATLAAKTPPSRSARRAAAANSAEVRWAGVRPSAKTSAMTRSKEPAVTRSRTALASPMCTLTRPRAVRNGSFPLMNRQRASSTSTAACWEAGRVAAT